MTESHVKIYFSRDYSLFRMIYGNRQLNETKIKKIKHDIANGLDVLAYCPIMVTQKGDSYEIIDGQHRFWVAKELKKPIHFVIIPEIDLMEIAKINSNTEKWKKSDFTNCFVTKGNEHYTKLRDFMDKYELPLTTAVTLLACGFEMKDFSGAYLRYFEEGKFEVLKEEDAIAIMECCKQFNVSKVWNHRPFILAVALIMKAGLCDITDIVSKFFKDVDQLKKQAGYKDYLVNLELIYNKGNHSRKVIYQ
jgi:hypothetical protein